MFGPSPRFQYYPAGIFGTQIARPANSKRKHADKDVVKQGEMYKSPADPFGPTLARAIEEPGVFAGFSARHNLPVISGDWPNKSGYVWCPLRNRVDLDRVHRQIATSGEFQDVHPLGSGGGPFKENPWGHMNPFQ